MIKNDKLRWKPIALCGLYARHLVDYLMTVSKYDPYHFNRFIWQEIACIKVGCLALLSNSSIKSNLWGFVLVGNGFESRLLILRRRIHLLYRYPHVPPLQSISYIVTWSLCLCCNGMFVLISNTLISWQRVHLISIVKRTQFHPNNVIGMATIDVRTPVVTQRGIGRLTIAGWQICRGFT